MRVLEKFVIFCVFICDVDGNDYECDCNVDDECMLFVLIFYL